LHRRWQRQILRRNPTCHTISNEEEEGRKGIFWRRTQELQTRAHPNTGKHHQHITLPRMHQRGQAKKPQNHQTQSGSCIALATQIDSGILKQWKE